MAVSVIRTNNLVKNHDLYVEFMKNRSAEINKGGYSAEDSVNLWCIPGSNYKAQKKGSSYFDAINRWHCIMLTYSIWCGLAKFYKKETVNSATPYKKIISMPEKTLRMFKERVEKAIESAHCKQTSRNKSKVDGCRYLAMYWTYLDIVKDTDTQRYLPDAETCKSAVSTTEIPC